MKYGFHTNTDFIQTCTPYLYEIRISFKYGVHVWRYKKTGPEMVFKLDEINNAGYLLQLASNQLEERERVKIIDVLDEQILDDKEKIVGYNYKVITRTTEKKSRYEH